MPTSVMVRGWKTTAGLGRCVRRSWATQSSSRAGGFSPRVTRTLPSEGGRLPARSCCNGPLRAAAFRGGQILGEKLISKQVLRIWPLLPVSVSSGVFGDCFESRASSRLTGSRTHSRFIFLPMKAEVPLGKTRAALGYGSSSTGGFFNLDQIYLCKWQISNLLVLSNFTSFFLFLHFSDFPSWKKKLKKESVPSRNCSVLTKPVNSY